jgi:hypothetical protein
MDAKWMVVFVDEKRIEEEVFCQVRGEEVGWGLACPMDHNWSPLEHVYTCEF